MSYIKYFDAKSFFQSQELLNTFNIDLEHGLMGDVKLNDKDREDLENAVITSNAASQNGNLAGVYNLISKVEELSGKYGRGEVWDHHHEELKDFVDEVASKPHLAKHYKVEGYRAGKPATTTTTIPETKKTRRG